MNGRIKMSHSPCTPAITAVNCHTHSIHSQYTEVLYRVSSEKKRLRNKCLCHLLCVGELQNHNHNHTKNNISKKKIENGEIEAHKQHEEKITTTTTNSTLTLSLCTNLRQTRLVK